MSREQEETIAARARRQHGVVTRSQLLASGVTAGAIRRRVRSGLLRPLHRGVYQVGPILPDPGRAMAAVLACGPDAWVAGRSAAALWGLLGRNSEDNRRPTPTAGCPVDILVVGRELRGRPGLRVQTVRALDDDERGQVGGIPVTAVGRTLVDLARVATPGELEGAAARAEREGLIGRASLQGLVERYRCRPGVRRLRACLEAPGGPALTRSEAEARFLALVRSAGLPAPRTNVPCAGYELDFLWPAHRIAVEVDGYRHHGERRHFEHDRLRARRLAARGIQIIPLTWRHIVDDPVATAVEIGQALALADPGRA